MKWIRVGSRICILSVAAAAFAGLTEIYGGSVQHPLPTPVWQQVEREHRPSAPDVSQFPEFVGECLVVATYAVGGRIVLRLRLSPVSPSKGQPILLALHRGR